MKLSILIAEELDTVHLLIWCNTKDVEINDILAKKGEPQSDQVFRANFPFIGIIGDQETT